METKQEFHRRPESYYSAMKQRLNLQSIGSFIREEGIKTEISRDSFELREKNAFSKLETWLTETYGKEETDSIIDYILDYMCVVQEIYFNLGMKAGTTLFCKLTDNFETDI
ncbi:MAG: hypothetical protein Q4P20_00715 [Eubacteriales bacterium]|nr:hypothetical protein [Eubacteriales bacterium]